MDNVFDESICAVFILLISIVLSINDPVKLFEVSVNVISFGDVLLKRSNNN